jgi:CBS domain-containing protein
MKARDVMRSHPSVALPGDSIGKAARILRDRSIGMLPVLANLRDRSLLGILTDRDIVVRCTAEGHGPECQVRDHMTKGPLVCVEPETEAGEVAARMEGFHLRRMPVVDRDGGVVGIVALADVLEGLRRAAMPRVSAADYGGVRRAAVTR